MPTHRKTPLFIRIITSKNKIICINPTNVFSFEIAEKATVRIKSKTPNDPSEIVGDTIYLYSPSGMGVNYTVGKDLTQEDFNNLCSTLSEYMYLNEAEFNAKSAQVKQEQMELWQKDSKQNEEKLGLTPTTTEPVPVK